MAKKSSNQAKIQRETRDIATILTEMPLNPIAWTTVVKLLAPVVARLAVRYALKRLNRSMGEEKVNKIGAEVGDFISDIIKKRVAPTNGTGSN